MAAQPQVYLPRYKFKDELCQTANKLATPGKGILAADESTGTIGKRLEAIKLENNKANRREYRRLLFTTPGLSEYVSGVITFEETLHDILDDKTRLCQPLIDQGIVLGIKVDLGTKPLPGCDDETYTQGLTDLDKRCQAYYKAGARFAKWRAVLRISAFTPSPQSIQETAHTLATYAAICQDNGLMPVVEPEILMDGNHSLEICQYWTEKVLAACYKSLSDQQVLLEGTTLKPNMVLPGQDCKTPYTTLQKATATLTALQRTVPPAVPAINFLSGGQTEEEATVNLNALNAVPGAKRPWTLTFSYGRALQKSCIQTWNGKPQNFVAAQKVLLARCRANGLASIGKYTGDAATADSSASLYVAGYKY